MNPVFPHILIQTMASKSQRLSMTSKLVISGESPKVIRAGFLSFPSTPTRLFARLSPPPLLTSSACNLSLSAFLLFLSVLKSALSPFTHYILYTLPSNALTLLSCAVSNIRLSKEVQYQVYWTSFKDTEKLV